MTEKYEKDKARMQAELAESNASVSSLEASFHERVDELERKKVISILKLCFSIL